MFSAFILYPEALAHFDSHLDSYPHIKQFYPFDFKKELFFSEEVANEFESDEPFPIGKKRQLCNLDRIRQSSLLQDFTVSKKLIDIYQTRMNILSAVGRLLPRISFELKLGPDPKVSQTFENLFGFFIPFNWFILFQNLNLFEAQKYALLDMLLDEFTLAEVSYFRIHKLKWDFAIKVFFYYKTLEILEAYGQDLENTESGKRTLNAFRTRLQVLKADFIKDKMKLKSVLLPELAFQVNIIKNGVPLNFDIDMIDLLDLEGKKSFAPKELSSKVLENSFKLKSYMALSKSAANGVGAQIFKNIGISDSKELGITLGLNTLSDILVLKGEYDRWQVNKEELKSSLETAFINAVSKRNTSLEIYNFQSKDILIRGKITLEAYLRKLSVDKKLSMDIYWCMLIVRNTYLQINEAIHTYMEAATLINRLLVLPQIKHIEKRFLPSKEQLRKAKLGIPIETKLENRKKLFLRYLKPRS